MIKTRRIFNLPESIEEGKFNSSSLTILSKITKEESPLYLITNPKSTAGIIIYKGYLKWFNLNPMKMGNEIKMPEYQLEFLENPTEVNSFRKKKYKMIVLDMMNERENGHNFSFSQIIEYKFSSNKKFHLQFIEEDEKIIANFDVYYQNPEAEEIIKNVELLTIFTKNVEKKDFNKLKKLDEIKQKFRTSFNRKFYFFHDNAAYQEGYQYYINIFESKFISGKNDKKKIFLKKVVPKMMKYVYARFLKQELKEIFEIDKKRNIIGIFSSQASWGITQLKEEWKLTIFDLRKKRNLKEVSYFFQNGILGKRIFITNNIQMEITEKINYKNLFLGLVFFSLKKKSEKNKVMIGKIFQNISFLRPSFDQFYYYREKEYGCYRGMKKYCFRFCFPGKKNSK